MTRLFKLFVHETHEKDLFAVNIIESADQKKTLIWEIFVVLQMKTKAK